MERETEKSCSASSIEIVKLTQLKKKKKSFCEQFLLPEKQQDLVSLSLFAGKFSANGIKIIFFIITYVRYFP